LVLFVAGIHVFLRAFSKAGADGKDKAGQSPAMIRKIGSR